MKQAIEPIVVDEPMEPGAAHVQDAPEHDLSERGMKFDENVPREGYNSGPLPLDPRLDDGQMNPVQDDPIEEAAESEFSRDQASGLEDRVVEELERRRRERETHRRG